MTSKQRSFMTIRNKYFWFRIYIFLSAKHPRRYHIKLYEETTGISSEDVYKKTVFPWLHSNLMKNSISDGAVFWNIIIDYHSDDFKAKQDLSSK